MKLIVNIAFVICVAIFITNAINNINTVVENEIIDECIDVSTIADSSATESYTELLATLNKDVKMLLQKVADDYKKEVDTSKIITKNIQPPQENEKQQDTLQN